MQLGGFRETRFGFNCVEVLEIEMDELCLLSRLFEVVGCPDLTRRYADSDMHTSVTMERFL